MNRNKKIISTILIMMAIAIGFVGWGFFDAKELGVNFFEEKVQNVAIKSEDDITEMGLSFHNNVCTLENDIVIKNSTSLATRELPFVGEFDGKGHKITFTGDVENSLFGYIGEGGVVKNLHIEVGSADISEKSAAILALENSGTIINCKITVKAAKVSVGGNHGAVVATNKGLIKNVVVKSKFENAVGEGVSRRSIIGGVAAYNYGDIESCFCDTSFDSFPETVKSNIFNGTAVNSSVGAVYGVNNGSVRKCVAIVGDETYVSDNKNSNITLVTEANRVEVFNEENIFGALGFDSELWIYLDNEFSLIQGEG